MCDWWIHFECEGMKRSEYNFFGRKTDALWFCSECTVEFRKRKEQNPGSAKNYFDECKKEIIKEMKNIIPILVKESLPPREKVDNNKDASEKHSIIFRPKDAKDNSFSKKNFF